MKRSAKKRVYLDHAATTPVCREALAVMAKLNEVFGNPSSLHYEGRAAAEVLMKSRGTIASLLKARPEELIFTSGGTEANSLAIMGVVDACGMERPHIVTTSIEHSSVLESVHRLALRGAEVTYIKPGPDGLIDPKAVGEAIKDNTVLVSVMYANNEIGTIEPVRDVAKIVRKIRKGAYPYLHIDAAQALSYCEVSLDTLGADLLCLDSGKIYGPKGTGLIYIRRGVKVSAQMLGGGQEGGMRSGTEDVVRIAGFARALEISERIKAKEVTRLTKLRDYMMRKLEAMGASINGGKSHRLPNNVSACFRALDAEFAVYQMDERGFAISSASTCMNNKDDSYSYVVGEVVGEDCKSSSLRITLGRSTTKREVDNCIKALKEVSLSQRWNTLPNSR